ncbi:Flp pilus assembly protein TadD [Bradyrhizobium sp. i1.3.1]
MRQRFSLARLLASTSLVAAVAMGLGGCTAMSKLSDVTGSVGPRTEAAPADPARAVDVYGERYRANPKDADAALGYGQALRANGQRAQAAAVLEQATIANPGNKALLAQYGRALADNGNFQQAFDVLSKAHSPDNPDWRLLSVQGTALDQMGRHDEARSYYASALRIAPGDPGVLSNLGLSYMFVEGPAEGRRGVAAGLRLAARQYPGAAESRPRHRSPGPFRRSRDDREGRPAARPGRGQCRLPQGNAEPQRRSARRTEADAGRLAQPARLIRT